MSVSVIAKSFSGKYGADADIGDIIHVHIEVGPASNHTTNKEITFLVDVSGSMENSMKQIKSSLLAFRDSLVNRTPDQMMNLDSDTKDDLIRNRIRSRLITFSNEAKEIWSNNSNDKKLEDCIIGLRSEALTNMGDALKLAFDKTDKNIFTWVIAMTDGESNKGPCRTADSFQKLVTSNKPLNTKVVSLGYGDNFDPEVLNVIGNFAYLDNSEVIPVVLGNLAQEVLSSVGFNCVIDLNKFNMVNEFTDDTVIIPVGENTQDPVKIIVGDRVIGTLCAEGSYDIIILPHGNKCSSSMLNAYDSINIRYTDIATRSEHTIKAHIEHTNEIPGDNIRRMYFESEKKRIIYQLYKAVRLNIKTLERTIKSVENTIESWNDDTSRDSKEEILKMIVDIRRNENFNCNRQASTLLNTAVSTGYTKLTEESRSTYTSARHYLASPLFNN